MNQTFQTQHTGVKMFVIFFIFIYWYLTIEVSCLQSWFWLFY